MLAGVAFQERYEKIAYQEAGGGYKIPESTWGQFRDGKAPQIERCLPDFAAGAFREAMPHLGKKLRGFDSSEAKLYAVETRSSSPIRILRGENREGRLKEMEKSRSLKGFYPCGEGAGYAGGITSAAVDGIRTAEAIIANWFPCFDEWES